MARAMRTMNRISAREEAVLAYVKIDPGRCIETIARGLDIDYAKTGRALLRLIYRGLITRDPIGAGAAKPYGHWSVEWLPTPLPDSNDPLEQLYAAPALEPNVFGSG